MEKGAMQNGQKLLTPFMFFSPKCFSILLPETFVLEFESCEGDVLTRIVMALTAAVVNVKL